MADGPNIHEIPLDLIQAGGTTQMAKREAERLAKERSRMELPGRHLWSPSRQLDLFDWADLQQNPKNLEI